MIVLRFSLRTTEFCFAEFHFKAENCCYKKEGAVYSMDGQPLPGSQHVYGFLPRYLPYSFQYGEARADI